MITENWIDLIKPEDNLLAVGCGWGIRISRIADKCNVFGMDIAEERFKDCPANVRGKLRYGDVTKSIPFKRKFDWVLLRDVIEHIGEEHSALRNISDSLKEDGVLIITTPRHIPFFNIYDPAWLRWKLGKGERHYHYKKSQLFSMLKSNNLIVEAYHIESGLRWLFVRWFNIFLKYIFKTNKLLPVKPRQGFFNWFIIARKRE